MRLDERITEAMSIVKASDDFTDRVIGRVSAADQGRHRASRKRGSALPIRAVAAAAVAGALMTSGVAYAVVSSDFFQESWGDHGLGGEVSWSAPTGKGTPGPAYQRDMGGTMRDDLADDLSASVEHVGVSVEGNGYTFTAEDIAIDENGCGAVSFTLENETGIVFNPDYGTPGELVLNSEAEGGLDSVFMRIGDEWANSRCFYDESSATDTRLKGTMYFDTRGSVDVLQQGITWQLNWHKGDEDDIETFQTESEPFAPTITLDAQTFVAADGSTASLSPLSLVMQALQPNDGQAYCEFVPRSITIAYDDGTEQVIQSSGDGDGAAVANAYISTLRDDGTISNVLTQLADVGNVASIHMDGRWYTGYESEGVDVTYEYVAR